MQNHKTLAYSVMQIMPAQNITPVKKLSWIPPPLTGEVGRGLKHCSTNFLRKYLLICKMMKKFT